MYIITFAGGKHIVSQNNFWKLVLSFHHVGLQRANSGHEAWRPKFLYMLKLSHNLHAHTCQCIYLCVYACMCAFEMKRT